MAKSDRWDGCASTFTLSESGKSMVSIQNEIEWDQISQMYAIYDDSVTANDCIHDEKNKNFSLKSIFPELSDLIIAV